MPQKKMSPSEGDRTSATVSQTCDHAQSSCRLAPMFGRFTYRLNCAEIIRLYRLMLDLPVRNTRPRYNICPTTTIDNDND
jgi:hypothetical protein